LIIATLIGGLAVILGVGGGFLMVPVFTILFGLDQRAAVGTSLAVIVATSFSGAFAYARQGRIFYRAACVVALPGIAGALIGGLITAYLPDKLLALIFSGVVIVFSAAMLCGKQTIIVPLTYGPHFTEECRDRYSTCSTMKMYYFHLGFWGFVAGAVGAICGLGGGVINVPALFLLGMPIHFAIATSTLIIFFTSLAGASVHLAAGHVDLVFMVIFAAGGFIGAQIGSRFAPGIPAPMLRKVIALLFILIGIGTAVKSVFF
jgi:uncharacterized protein